MWKLHGRSSRNGGYDAYILDLGLPDNAMGKLIDLVRDCDPDVARKSAIVTAFPTVARADQGHSLPSAAFGW